jgi:hypothetical protein
MQRGVVGLRLILGVLLAARDRRDAAISLIWFGLGHGPLGQLAALA